MKKLALTTSLLFAALLAFGQLAVKNLKVENLTNPVGLDETQPRFSWQMESPACNVLQTAYEIRVGNDAAAVASGKKLTWSSGKTASDASVFVSYGGPAMQPGKKYFWQVTVWDNQGNTATSGGTDFWQTGLLSAANWKAKWIATSFQEDTVQQPSPLFRKEFAAKKVVKSATAYITSKGLYEANINGQRVGDACLTPGWTAYQERIQYQAYDVTNLVKQGPNALGITLGNGWYRGFIGFSGQHSFYGKELGLLFQLDIVYTDGKTESIVSDGSWKCSTGSIVSSEIYHGETIDARLEKTGWNKPGFNDTAWPKVKLTDGGPAAIVATYNEPIRKQTRFTPKSIFTTPKGEQVIDFGQNLVGWVEVQVSGKAGDKITLYHAEVLDKAGNFYTENLRPAKQMNTYILKGGGAEFFEPHFTFQGFRYLRVEGFPGDILPENFTAVALYSDMPETGTFSCSNPLINQLQHNIQWGQRGNFLDVPTDCPQRDERLGWTGDAQAFSRTATFNHDAHNFYLKWLKDVALDQRTDGSVPFVVPNVLGEGACGSTGWADVATIVPWNVYLAYGDKRVLENQFESMKAWVDYMTAQSQNDLWNNGFHFGDWLFYSENNDNIGNSAVTQKPLIQQCFWAHSTQLVINAANVLGKKEEADSYRMLLAKIKGAFLREYVTPSGALVSGTQTAYVLALNFDMLPENMRQQAAERLVTNIDSYGTHLTTGFLGTPYLCHVLNRFGHTDVAYKLLLREKYPSWLYPVTMGATTIWERWDGIRPDSTFEEASMNSFNHYAYGAIGDWMYRTIAGINTDENAPGYKRMVIKPYLGEGLTEASAEYLTPYGKVKSHWQTTGGHTRMEVEIPPNTSAVVHLPASTVEAVKESGKTLAEAKLSAGKTGKGYIVLDAVGSGSYVFEW
ncbi:MAG: glycoside hydrolase family 78 protein [Bacteroidetes bacterium]|nr:glycoside hydrolase family 78 protein [Bacteroidota bacterium]